MKAHVAGDVYYFIPELNVFKFFQLLPVDDQWLFYHQGNVEVVQDFNVLQMQGGGTRHDGKMEVIIAQVIPIVQGIYAWQFSGVH
jgi:hypothetical protein